jgi:hypothetical protein
MLITLNDDRTRFGNCLALLNNNNSEASVSVALHSFKCYFRQDSQLAVGLRLARLRVSLEHLERFLDCCHELRREDDG